MIYGDQLAFFTEQFRQFDYFSMTPDAVAAYSNRVDLGKVTGVFQYAKKGEITRENETLADIDVPTIWTRKKLKVGNYISFDDTIFRIIDPISWAHEGGFYCYVLQTMVGNTDRQQPFDYVDLGQNSYD